MNLIVDTSSNYLHLILEDKGKIIQSEQGATHEKFQEFLLPRLDKMLTDAKVRLENIGEYSVVVGPGSFTGIRVGVTMAKAFLSVFKDKKVIQINLLELLILKLKSVCKGDFLVLIECTKSKFYAGIYKNQNISYEILIKEQLEDIKGEFENIFCYENLLVDGAKKVELTDQDYINYVSLKRKSKSYVSASEIEPIYMALSQAEEELLKRENKTGKK